MKDAVEPPDPLLTALDDSQVHLVDLTLDLLSYDTQNPPGQTDAAISFVEEYLEDAGIDTRTVAADGDKPNLLARVPGANEDPFVFNGHLDTVPFDAEQWTHDPLGERHEGRLYGRGATDMKGPLASMIETMVAFAETGVRPPSDLVLALVSDEEVPSDVGVEALVDGGLLENGVCVIGETTCDGQRFSVSVADKGSIWLSLEAEGSAAHGSRPMAGENAIDSLYGAITDLRETLSKSAFQIPPAVEEIVSESIEYYESTLGRETASRLFRYPTVNLGTLEGGQSVNTVPERATASIDIRITPGIDTRGVLGDVRSCLEEHDAVDITETDWSQGTFEEPDSPLVMATKASAEAVLDTTVSKRCATGGGDAKTLRNSGVSTVEFGVGSGTAHGVDEYIPVSALLENARIYATIPFAYAARQEKG
ncbi:MAG: M20 family metallopeptidase [Halodesulfurarchaeum sp.]